MVKFKLKRKMSGKKIRKDMRKKQIHPTETKTYTDYDGNVHVVEVPIHVKYPNRGLYRRNLDTVKVRKDNQIMDYESQGDKPIGSFYAARLPRKKRKTAWKRFNKLFPNIKVGRGGKKVFVEVKSNK